MSFTLSHHTSTSSDFETDDTVASLAVTKRLADSPAAPKVLVSGFYGAVNVGDEAVCEAVLTGVRRVFPDASLQVITTSSDRSREFTNSGVNYFNGFYPSKDFWAGFPSLVKDIASSDLVIIGGGGILQDVHSWKSACRHLVIGALATALGRPVITVGLGVGPFQRSWLRRLTGRVVTDFALIQVRDESSRSELEACGVSRNRIRVTSDVVPALPALERTHTSRGAEATIRKVGLALRKWPSLDDLNVASLVEAIVASGCEVWLLCYEPKHDRRFYEKVLERISDRTAEGVLIHEPTTLTDAIDTIERMDAVISMRLHGCVFSAAFGIPFLAIPYDPKVASFVSDAGVPTWQCPVEDVGPGSWAKLQEVITEHSTRLPVLDERFSVLRERATQNFEDLASSIKSPVLRGTRFGILPVLGALVVAGLVAAPNHNKRPVRYRIWKQIRKKLIMK